MKNYTENIAIKENDADVKFDVLEKTNMINIFGICDYDSFSLAQKQDRILVTAEITHMFLTEPKQNNMSGIGIINFLCAIQVRLSDLLDYMIQMVKYRFLITITEVSINYIISEFNRILEVDERENVLMKWIDYLSLAEELDEKYRAIFIEIIVDVYSKLFNEHKKENDPIWYHLGYYIFKYRNLIAQIRLTEDGEIAIKISQKVSE